MMSLLRRDWIKVSLWLAGTLVLGAALAPWFFNGGKHWAAWVSAEESRSAIPVIGWVGEMAAHADFKRYFNRAFLVAAVVLLWPLILSMRAADGAKGFSLERNPNRVSQLLLAWVLAAGILLAMGFAFQGMGFFSMTRPAEWGSWLSTALIAGLGAAVMEEIFFRGLLMGVLLRRSGEFMVLFFVTAFFAVIHFLKPPENLVIPDHTVNWQSGFFLVGVILRHFLEPEFLLAELGTLFAVGWVLGAARLKTKSLWMSIGLHGGWVFGLKLFSACTRREAPLEVTLPWIGDDLKTGLVPLVLVCLTGWLALKAAPRKGKSAK